MMNIKRCLRLGLCGLLLLCVLGASGAADAHSGEAYLRVTEQSQGVSSLETAARRFEPADGAGPEIWLVGVIHIGEKIYYQSLQELLDRQSLVLFEGVGRPEFIGFEPGADTERIQWTRDAADYLARLYLWYFEQGEEWPTGLEDLQGAMSELRRQELDWLSQARTDAWGRDWQFEADAGQQRLGSLGADGEPGGEGADADIWIDLADIKDDDALSNLQSSLATALKLDFQSEGIDYNRAHFRNSDMSLRQLRTALSAANAAGEEDEILQLLEGNMPGGELLEKLLTMIGGSPQFQALARQIMIEVLAEPDTLDQLGERFDSVMEVLVVDRNRIVLDDLRRALAAGDAGESIALFYGAGHMDDLEQVLVGELNYQPSETVWERAMVANLAETGLAPAQLNFIRAMLDNI
jgi:hypothetical protein